MMMGIRKVVHVENVNKGGLEDFGIRKLGGREAQMNDLGGMVFIGENQYQLYYSQKKLRLWCKIASNHANTFLFLVNST